MNAFDLIQARALLHYEYKNIEDDSGWVTDWLEGDAMEWCRIPNPNAGIAKRYFNLNDEMLSLYPRSQWPVLIQAPTGRGKNWFTINCLAKYAGIQGRRVLLLTNRSALTKQQRLEAAAEFDFPDYGQDVYDGCCIWSNMDIINYHNALEYIFDPNNLTKYQVSLVVFDEAHFFCSDSPYNSETSNILQQLIKYFSNCKRVYMSATPDEVKDILALEELRGYLNRFIYGNTLVNGSPITNIYDDPIQMFLNCLYQIPINMNNQIQRVSNIGYQGPEVWQRIAELQSAPLPSIKQYEFKSNYDHINLHFFYDWKEIEDIIKLEQDESENVADRWLIFVSKKEDGKNLKQSIKEDVFFVYSDSEGAIGEEDEDSKVKRKLNEVVSNRYFQEKVMISTTVLYNGVSLEDSHLKNIVVDTLCKDDIIQMAGRKRCAPGEKVNLYIRIPTVDIIKERIKRANKRYKSTQQYLKDPNNFFYKQWKKSFFDPDLKEIFDFRRSGNGTPIFVMSEYAPRHFAMESGHYSRMIELLQNNEAPYTLEEEISSWFDKELSDAIFGETHYDIRKELLDRAKVILDAYVEKECFDVDQCEKLFDDLYNLIYLQKKHISDKPLPFKLSTQKDKEDRDYYSQMLTNIRAIFTFCDLPYKVWKDEKTIRSPDRSKWKYHCERVG